MDYVFVTNDIGKEDCQFIIEDLKNKEKLKLMLLIPTYPTYVPGNIE